MQPSGTFENSETIHAWADITLKIWHAKLTELKIWETGDLYSSLKNELYNSAANNVERVDFAFNLYGIFVDMGVGREISRGNGGDLGFSPVRKRKEWYSRVFYREVMKLREILLEKYGKQVAELVVSSMKPVKDVKYDYYRKNLRK